MQLSTLDLKQEIQDALESNLMLETEEERAAVEGAEKPDNAANETASDAPGNDINNEQEIRIESQDMPDELPVDTAWEELYDSAPGVGATASSAGDSSDYLAQQSSSESLQDYLTWQMQLSHLNPARPADRRGHHRQHR